MSSQDRLIWFKGALMPPEKAQVPVLSPTAQFGLNVFEGLRGYWNVEREDVYVFRMDDHLARLAASCRLIGIESPYSADHVATTIREVLRANSYRADIAVRVTLFVDGEGSWSNSEPVDMCVAPIAKARRDIADMSGVRACVSTWERIDDRNLPPRVKAGANYINGRYAHLEARAAGYDLPILLDRSGKVSEGAGSCLMMVRDGVLVTPPVTASILESITRDTLLQLAAPMGIQTETRVIDRTELYLASEVFLCGSTAEITPVTSVDRYKIGDGKLGPLTQRLLQRYLAVVSGQEDFGVHSWCAPVWHI